MPKAKDLSALHRAAFGQAGWGDAAFAQLLADPNVQLFEGDQCFALFQVAGDEAEILTIATHPDVQGKGRAQSVLSSALAKLRDLGCQRVFLEVAEDNTAARALYAHSGFEKVGLRKRYYRRANGTRIDAQILSLTL